MPVALTARVPCALGARVRSAVFWLSTLACLGCAGALPVAGDDACLPLAGARREGLAVVADRLVWTEAHARADGTTRWDLWTSSGEGAGLLAADVGWDARPLPAGGFGGTRSTEPAGRFGWVRIDDGASRQISPAAHDVLAWASSPSGRLWWLAASGTGDPVAWVLEDDGTSTPTWTATRMWGATEQGAIVRGVSGGTWLLPRDGAAPQFLGADADEIALHDGVLVRSKNGAVERADARTGASLGAPQPGVWVPGGWIRTRTAEGDQLRAVDGRSDPLVVRGGAPSAVAEGPELGRWALVAHDSDGDGRIGPSDEADVCRLGGSAPFRDRSIPLRFVGREGALAAALPTGATARFAREARAIEVSLPGNLPDSVDEAFAAAEALADGVTEALRDDQLDVAVTWVDGRADRHATPRGPWTQLDAHGVTLRRGDGLLAELDLRLDIERGRGTLARVRWSGTAAPAAEPLNEVSIEVGAWSLLGEDPVLRRVDLGELAAERRWTAGVTVDMARHPDLRVTVRVGGQPVPFRERAAEREALDWWRTVDEARAIGFVHDWRRDGVRIPGRIDHDLAAFLAPPGFSRLPDERQTDLARRLGATLDRHYAEAHGSGWLGAGIIDGEARVAIDRDGRVAPDGR